MSIKIKGQFLIRRDTTANWDEHKSFVPKKGEFIVYTDYKTTTNSDGKVVNIAGIKIGDGDTYCIDLPFVTDAVDSKVLNMLKQHEENLVIHVSKADRDRWDGKVSCYINGERMLLK